MASKRSSGRSAANISSPPRSVLGRFGEASPTPPVAGQVCWYWAVAIRQDDHLSFATYFCAEYCNQDMTFFYYKTNLSFFAAARWELNMRKYRQLVVTFVVQHVCVDSNSTHTGWKPMIMSGYKVWESRNVLHWRMTTTVHGVLYRYRYQSVSQSITHTQRMDDRPQYYYRYNTGIIKVPYRTR